MNAVRRALKSLSIAGIFFAGTTLSFAGGAHSETIGVILPLTGGWATWGERIRESLELFQEEHNGSFPFEFRFEDEETCDIKKALAAYRRLRSEYHARIFVAGCASGTEAIAPVAKQEGALLLSSGFQQNSLFQRNIPIVNFALQIGSEGKTIGNFIRERRLLRVAAVRNPEGDEFVAQIRNALSGSPSTVAFDEVIPTTEKDLSTNVTKIRAANLDGLFLNLDEQQLANLLQSLAKQQVHPTVVTAYGTEILARDNPDLLKLAEGVYYSFPQASSGGEAFQTRFRSRFGHDPSVSSAFVFDGMTLLLKALPACANMEKDAADKRERCLFSKLTGAGPQDGLSGKFEIRPDGSIDRGFIIKRIHEGKFEPAP